MPVDIEIAADEWEAFRRDMELINAELYAQWCRDLEEDFG